MHVNRIVLRAKDATVPLQASILKDNSQQQEQAKCKDTPDFFVKRLVEEVNQATPSQRKEWKKTGKSYLKTFATTTRMLPLSVLTLAAAPTTMPGTMPGQTIINILTLPLVWLMEMVMPKPLVPPMTAPETKTATIPSPAVPTPHQAAISVPQSPSIPHAPIMQQPPLPAPTHGAESLIPTPVFTPGTGPDLTDIAQTALLFIITNGFYILLAVLAATGIMKAFGAHTLAKKVALNTVKGIGILLLSTPAVVLMLYIVMFIMGQFPGFHPPIPVNR